MNKSKDGPPAHFEVEDAEAAFRKMEIAARKILAVPRQKANVLAKKKAPKKQLSPR